MLIIYKEKLIVEDVEFGFGTVEQTRELVGVPTVITYHKINASYVPALSGAGAEATVQAVLDEKDTKLNTLATFAPIAGNVTQEFAVAIPSVADSAANKSYVDSVIQDVYTSVGANYVTSDNVLTRDNVDIYSPTGIYHPATKQYVDQTVVDIGAGNMATGTYDIMGNGIVDNTEAVGGIVANKVVMHRGTSTADAAIIQGVTETTGTTQIVLTLTNSDDINLSQLRNDYSSGRTATRHKQGTSAWSNWRTHLIDTDIEDSLTSTDATKVLSAAQGKVLSDTVSGIESVPLGTIVMFAGTIATLNPKWKICDGTNGTPNLIDKFIMGTATQTSIGLTGGTLESTMPAHTHELTHSHTAYTDTTGGHFHSAAHSHTAWGNSTGSHQHTVPMELQGLALASGGIGVNLYAEVGTKYTGWSGEHSHDIYVNTASFNTSTNGDHSHVVSINSNTTTTTTASVAGDNRPPYYTLAYIMKVA